MNYSTEIFNRASLSLMLLIVTNMKQWYALYVCLYSYEFVIWPDCFVGHSCPGDICPESGPLSSTCSITTMLGTLLMIDT